MEQKPPGRLPRTTIRTNITTRLTAHFNIFTTTTTTTSRRISPSRPIHPSMPGNNANIPRKIINLGDKSRSSQASLFFPTTVIVVQHATQNQNNKETVIT